MAEEIITPTEYGQDAYMSLLVRARSIDRKRLLVGIPTTGLVRMEWALGRYGQIMPTNWSSSDCIQWISQLSPLNYSVADARNIISQTAVLGNFDWLFFLDSDVILPPNALLQLNPYIREGKIPVVTGLYFTKSAPAEPLLYRGRGTSYYAKWKLGEKIWVDGICMGCTLIHTSILRTMWHEAPEYIAGGNQRVRRIFDTPAFVAQDPEQAYHRTFCGTEDLAWSTRVIQGEFLKKAGWGKIAKRRYPFLVDTNLFCKHISEDGRQYPLELVW